MLRSASVRRTSPLFALALLAALALARGALASPLAFVANTGSDDVTVVDLDTLAVRTSGALVDHPEDVAVSPDGRSAYFATDEFLTVLDTRTLATRTITLPSLRSSSLAVHPTTGRVYVGHERSADISVVNVANQTVRRVTLPSSDIRHLALSANGDFLFALTSGGDVVRMDTGNEASTRIFSAVMPGATGLAVDTFGSVWMGSDINLNVRAFSVSSTGVPGMLLTIASGYRPGRIGIDRAFGFGAVALVVKPFNDQVARYWGNGIQLPAGANPRDVDASADRVIVVANDADVTGQAPSGNGSITIVPPSGPVQHLPGGRHPKVVAVGPRMWAELTATPSSGVRLWYFATGTYLQRVTLKASGWDALSVGALRFSGTSAARFTLANDGCSGHVVPVGGTCTVDVSFSYTRPAGWVAGVTYSATLEVPSNAQGAAVTTLPVSARQGFGLIPAGVGAFGG